MCALKKKPSSKKVVAIRITSKSNGESAIYRGGKQGAPETLEPIVKFQSPDKAGNLTSNIKVAVSSGSALVHIAPQSWVPPKCIEYFTSLLGGFGLEKIDELNLWSVPSKGDVAIPRDLAVDFTNGGVAMVNSYVSTKQINLAKWAGESDANTTVSVYIALELDPGAKGSITVTDPTKGGAVTVVE